MIKMIIAMLVLTATTTSAQTDTYVVARTATKGGAYHLAEVFQQRGKVIFPDIGYIDFNTAREYREFFIGAGAMLVNKKHVIVIHEGYLDKAAGPSSGGALYYQPWTLVICPLTSNLAGEVVYFPYLPLNKAARVQHVLERVKLEYSLKHIKMGAGYGGYKFGDDAWQSKPFITLTAVVGSAGSLELWLQTLPHKPATVQVRYAKTFHSAK